MKVGLTYDLRDDYLAAGFSEEEAGEFDKPETIEAIEDNLRSLGFQTDRIGNLGSLMVRLIAGDRWDVVFNIAEGVRGVGREAQVPALLDAYGIPYTFSDPLVLSVTLHKGVSKQLVNSHGIPTPAFVVVETEEDVRDIDLPLPLFVKPVAEGTGKGISAASKVNRREELARVCRRLLHTYRQPVLVETFLPGKEYTVGIIGSAGRARALGVMEVQFGDRSETDAYTYLNKANYQERVTYRLVTSAEAEAAARVALDAWCCLGCRDAGRVDLRADSSGRIQFLEVNPLAGLNPIHSDLPILCRLVGMSYRQLIAEVMDQTLRRLGLEAPPAVYKEIMRPKPSTSAVNPALGAQR